MSTNDLTPSLPLQRVVWLKTSADALLPPPADPLEERAVTVWPDHLPGARRNREEWIRAVRLVRGTKRGWVCDQRDRNPMSWPSVEVQQ